MPKGDTVLAALGASVRRWRETRALTQEKLAERAGLDPMPLAHRMGEGSRVRGVIPASSAGCAIPAS